MAKPELSAKETARRQMMLAGSQLKILLLISLPLVFYNSLGQIFQLIDTIIAANMSAGVVSTVSFVMQIEKMLMAIGTGLSVAGGILIARTYGAGDMEKFHSQTSTLFFIVIFVGIAILAVVIPLMYPILRIFNMPDELIVQGTIYSSILVGSIIFQLINTIFFAIQKSRGNTKVIMFGNLLVLAIKTSLNVTTMHLIQKGIVPSEKGIYFLPAATILAHATLSVIAISNLVSNKNPFYVRLRFCEFKKTFIGPLTNLGIPVFLEKFVFAFGKAIVNSLCAGFGPTVVGALGVSDRLCGLSTNPITGFQEAESSLVSNNIGNKNIERATGFFYRTVLLTSIYVLIFFVLTGIFRDEIIAVFAKGDPLFAAEIVKIYTYERFDTILTGLNSATMGLLYGFGKTKISMAINISRLFVFRIPPLLIFMNVAGLKAKLGTSAVGISMLISNGCTGLIAGAIALILIRKVLRENKV
ncbi:MAG: MATE family efflux transporter [Treponema sp.]|nr:MATE family efflux transporter [Candidatus Treponema equifaecale]